MADLEPILLSCSTEDAHLYRLQRKITDGDFDFRDIPRDFPDNPTEANERLKQAELMVIGGEDYRIGRASQDDDIVAAKASDRILLTAEHATSHFTIKDGNQMVKPAEKGTGGLAYLLALETKNDAIIAAGRQTGNVTWGEHLIKDAMQEVVVLEANEAHLSIHGLATGLAYDPKDHQGFDVLIGIGDSPSDATNTMVYDYLLPAAEARGYKVGVNQPFVAFDRQTDMPLMNADGTANTKVFKGPKTGTTAFSQQLAREAGKEDSYVAVQLELAGIIRYQRNVWKLWPNRESRELGIYLGYLFIKLAIESIDKL